MTETSKDYLKSHDTKTHTKYMLGWFEQSKVDVFTFYLRSWVGLMFSNIIL